VKRLAILIDGRAWFDGEVSELQVTDNEKGITVSGRYTAEPSLAEKLTGSLVARNRERALTQYNREPPPLVEDRPECLPPVSVPHSADDSDSGVTDE
jgi:hypothetical protein